MEIINIVVSAVYWRNHDQVGMKSTFWPMLTDETNVVLIILVRNQVDMDIINIVVSAVYWHNQVGMESTFWPMLIDENVVLITFRPNQFMI